MYKKVFFFNHEPGFPVSQHIFVCITWTQAPRCQRTQKHHENRCYRSIMLTSIKYSGLASWDAHEIDIRSNMIYHTVSKFKKKTGCKAVLGQHSKEDARTRDLYLMSVSCFGTFASTCSIQKSTETWAKRPTKAILDKSNNIAQFLRF